MDTYTKNYSRKEVIEKFRWREGLISLQLSKHCLRRIEERVDGEFPIVPTMVRITKDNICSGRSQDGKKLSSVKIRLDYKRDKWMFLVICPFSGVVKTLYINYKDAKKEKAARERQGIKEDTACCEEEYYEKVSHQEETKECREDTGREGRGDYNETFYANPVGETSYNQKMLGMWWKNLWRQFNNLLGPSA